MAPRRSGLPPEPGVATGYELADDGKTYTFHLRADARWSDGRPVTAGDFVYSWLRALDPATGSVTVETLYYLENAEKFNKGALTDRDLVGVHAPDDHTLVVRLERPTPFWIALVTHSQYYPVPRWAIEEHGRQWTRPENIVTNGAYRVVEQRPRERVVLERSPTYWDAANVRIPRIVARSSTSENQDITLYDSGQIQYARMGVPPAELTARMTSGEPDLIIDQRLCYYQYTFNTEHPPFDDERVRRAIVMAIDKDRLVGSVTRGREVPADGVVLDYFVDAMGYPDPEGLPFDVAAARKLLAEAGFPGGKGLPPVTLSYNTLDRHQAIAEFVQRQLKENLNFDVTLENMEFKSLLKKVRAKDFDITRRGWCGEEHPYTMLEIFRSTSPRNPSGWKSAEFDSLLERSLGPRDPKVAKTLNNLAVLYQAKGEPKAAMPLIERAAAVAGEALGPNNPTTETLKRNRETLARLIATKSPAPAAPPRTSIVAAMLPAGDAKARAPEPAASGHAPAPVRQAAVSSGAPSSAPSSAQDDGLGPYALHLASVRTAADTEGEWRRLAKLHGLRPDLVARPPERVEIAGKGVFYRVLRGAYATKAEAEGACAVVEAKGAYCTVRKLR